MKPHPSLLSRLTLCLSLVGLGGLGGLGAACGCKSSDKAAPTAGAPVATPKAAPTPAPAPAPGPTAAASLTDPQIAAIVVAANQVDIDAGTLANRKSHDPEVTKFATLMVTDHTAINQAAVALVTKLGVTPVESPASAGLVAGGADNRKKLEALDGAAFDRAYLDNEVAYHQAVIDVVDHALIPSAQNAELKKMLVDVRPALVVHLEHAQHARAALDGAAAMDHAGH